MRQFFSAFVLSAAFLVFHSALALADAPFQIALAEPVQLVDRSDDVRGLRLNLLRGVNRDTTGLDLGIINEVDGQQTGVQIGIYNNTFATSGVQIGLVNRTRWLDGLQIGLVNIHTKGRRTFFPIVNYQF